MFSFFRKKSGPQAPAEPVAAEPPAPPEQRQGWVERLRGGLRKTGSSITQVFTGARIDEALYDELEAALLVADAGPTATRHILDDLKRRVRERGATEPAAVKALLEDALTDLLAPLQRALEIGRSGCTVMMVVGVNGAGKTTSIGKLACHLAQARQRVLLAAADTFRAAAREQLAVWADRVAARGAVEIVSQQGGDPAAVTFDAVTAGRARGCDVVIADTAGRLPTQLHLMDELKKIRRVINKADAQAPHEVLLVVDGNTGQNALAQVKAFDAALELTGLIVTKLDGTAKGGVLAAIALWARERAAEQSSKRALAVYFLGVGEALEDLQTFDAREFAQALLG
jgi:fused signal recognition particle receptor